MTGITIEHAQIIDWTHARGGHPAIERQSEDTAQPVICFSNEGDGVSWDEWISLFERGEWVFIYEDRTAEGELSRSWRIIPRFEEESKWTHEVENAQTC